MGPDFIIAVGILILAGLFALACLVEWLLGFWEKKSGR